MSKLSKVIKDMILYGSFSFLLTFGYTTRQEIIILKQNNHEIQKKLNKELTILKDQSNILRKDIIRQQQHYKMFLQQYTEEHQKA